MKNNINNNNNNSTTEICNNFTFCIVMPRYLVRHCHHRTVPIIFPLSFNHHSSDDVYWRRGVESTIRCGNCTSTSSSLSPSPSSSLLSSSASFNHWMNGAALACISFDISLVTIRDVYFFEGCNNQQFN